jgi:hypothetical protein
MKVLLVVVLVAAGMGAQTPEYRHDKYKDDPHARCMRPEAVEMYGKENPSLHPCTCHETCATQADGTRIPTEDPKCELYCTKQRCGCHVDEEACDVPKVARGAH